MRVSWRLEKAKGVKGGVRYEGKERAKKGSVTYIGCIFGLDISKKQKCEN